MLFFIQWSNLQINTLHLIIRVKNTYIYKNKLYLTVHKTSHMHNVISFNNKIVLHFILKYE